MALAVVPAFILPFEQLVPCAQAATTVHVLHKYANDVNHMALASESTVRHTWQNFRLPKPSESQISPLTHLPVLADGSTAMPSNATNFHDAANASVDPRTGVASFGFTVASALYNLGQSRRELTLSYAGGTSARGPDTLGLGPHWSFNVGMETPSTSEVLGHKTTDITTGDGHSFTMVNDRDTERNSYWHPLRHKLGDVTITGEPGDWTIATATGTREHLQYGYEDWEEDRGGQRVWFYYDRHGPQDTTRRLLYMCAHPLTQAQVNSAVNQCQDNGVRVTYSGDDVTVHGKQNIVLHMSDLAGKPIVQSIVIPSLSTDEAENAESDTISFSYDGEGGRPWLLKTVTQPSGETTTFMYNDESDHDTLQPQGLPAGFNKARMPVVTEQITTPAPENKKMIPVRRVWYQYSGSPTDQHNYMGYLSGVSNEPGKDNLFDRADDYTYTVSSDNGLTKTTTTYNKYHLPLSVTQTEDLRHSLIAKNEINYLPWKGTTFAQLQPTYSLPQETTKTLYSTTSQGNDSAVAPAKVLQQSKYDKNGQVIWKEDAYGRQTFIRYCPPQGDNHCPKMDPHWPQVTLPEKLVQLPATETPQGSVPFERFISTDDTTPAEEVEFNYRLIPVAGIYKSRVQQYQQLLQHQWEQAKEKTQNNREPTQSDLFSRERFINDVGLDTSPLAGNWQVSTKTTGTLPRTSVENLQSGQPLPELSENQITTTTDYQYNPDQKSPVYGQLTRLTVTRYPLQKPLVSASLMQETGGVSEKMTFSITHVIDADNHTRTTDVEVVPEQAPADIKEVAQQLRAESGDDGGLSLGKSVYSLTTGVKISDDDTLKTLHRVWSYDIWNRPVKEVITPVTGGHSESIKWTFISTRKELSAVKTLPSGSQQKTVYGGSGKAQKVISTWHRYKNQAMLPMAGKAGWIEDSSSAYTITGKLASETKYHAADNNGKTISLTTTYGYDTLNRLVWERSPDGTVSVRVRNDPQMLLISYSVGTDTADKSEKLSPILNVVQSNTLGKPVANYQFALASDAQVNGKAIYTGELKKKLVSLEGKLQPADSLKSLQSYGLLSLPGNNGLLAFVNDAIAAKAWLSTMTIQYDGQGRRIEQTQPNGAQTHWTWQQGNMVATIAPDGSLIHDSFNVVGNKVSRCVQPADQSTCHVLGKRGYDEEGNLAWQADEYGNRDRYTYDADGRLLSMITPATKTNKSHVFTYTYNSFAKTSEAVDGVVYATYSYDPATWALTDEEDTIGHLHYDYDENTGRLIKITRTAPQKLKSPTGIRYPSGIESMTYDRYGEPMSVTDLAGDRYTAIHDRYGRVLQAQVTLLGQTKAVLLASDTYDPFFGRLTAVINGAGTAREFVYDDFGNLASTIDKEGNKVLQQLSYTYDLQSHNILTFTRWEKGNSATQTYSYDKNTNSLTAMTCSVTGRSGVASILCPRDTDLSGSTLTVPPIIKAQHYTFDDWNNIRTVSEQLMTSGGKSVTKTTDYSYDMRTNDSYDPHRMTAFNTRWSASVSHFSTAPKTLTYDGLGRIIKDADGNILHYNARGFEDGFTHKQTGEHTVWFYDSAGHQVSEQMFNSKGAAIQAPLYMVYQGNMIAEQVQNDAQGKTHTSAELATIAHVEDGKITRWYLHDYKGDVIASLDATGQKVSDHVYSPYGMNDDLLKNNKQALAQSVQAIQAPWWKNHQPGFDGQMTDFATGYQFLGGGYRAYNPVYRHFMSRDSYSPFKKMDGYGFGGNNPVMNTDPTGHMPKWAGYAFGALSMVMAVASAFFLPVASAVTASVSEVLDVANFGVFSGNVGAVLGIGSAAIGLASGSLQISATARPGNKALAIASDAFGIANGVSAFAIGVFSAIPAATVITGLGAVTGSMILTSGAGSMLSGVTQAASSSLDVSMATNSVIAQNSQVAKAANILGYMSMAFMSVSIVGSVGGFVASVMDHYQLKDLVYNSNSVLSFGRASRNGNVSIRYTAAGLFYLDSDSSVYLAQDKLRSIRRVLVSRTRDPETLSILSRDSDYFIRKEVAKSSATKVETLQNLSTDPFSSIRNEVLLNNNVSLITLQNMVYDDPSRFIKMLALDRILIRMKNSEGITEGDLFYQTATVYLQEAGTQQLLQNRGSIALRQRVSETIRRFTSGGNQ